MDMNILKIKAVVICMYLSEEKQQNQDNLMPTICGSRNGISSSINYYNVNDNWLTAFFTPEVPDLVRQHPGHWRPEDVRGGQRRVDHGGVLRGESQRAHVDGQVGVERHQAGRLEEEDGLHPGEVRAAEVVGEPSAEAVGGLLLGLFLILFWLLLVLLGPFLILDPLCGAVAPAAAVAAAVTVTAAAVALILLFLVAIGEISQGKRGLRFDIGRILFVL